MVTDRFGGIIAKPQADAGLARRSFNSFDDALAFVDYGVKDIDGWHWTHPVGVLNGYVNSQVPPVMWLEFGVARSPVT
jgi:hypothetical protein